MTSPSDPDSPPSPQPERGALRSRLRALEAWPPEFEREPGRRPPRRFSALTWFQALWPGIVNEFDKTVPDEFWTWEEWDGVHDEERVALVACMCGEETRVEQNGTAICAGSECGRVFLLVGETIRVAKYEPAELAAAESPAS